MKKFNIALFFMLSLLAGAQIIHAGGKGTGAACRHDSDCKSGACYNMMGVKLCAAKGSAGYNSRMKHKKKAKELQSDNNDDASDNN